MSRQRRTLSKAQQRENELQERAGDDLSQIAFGPPFELPSCEGDDRWFGWTTKPSSRRPLHCNYFDAEHVVEPSAAQRNLFTITANLWATIDSLQDVYPQVADRFDEMAAFLTSMAAKARSYRRLDAAAMAAARRQG